MSNLTTISILALTVKLSADIKKYLFIEADGSLPTVGKYALGTTQRDGKSGEQVAVLTMGKGIVVAGEAVAVNTAIHAGADGKAYTRTGTNVIVGRTLTAATAAEDEVEYVAIPN